jgi:hypothetical protein
VLRVVRVLKVLKALEVLEVLEVLGVLEVHACRVLLDGVRVRRVDLPRLAASR